MIAIETDNAFFYAGHGESVMYYTYAGVAGELAPVTVVEAVTQASCTHRNRGYETG